MNTEQNQNQFVPQDRGQGPQNGKVLPVQETESGTLDISGMAVLDKLCLSPVLFDADATDVRVKAARAIASRGISDKQSEIVLREWNRQMSDSQLTSSELKQLLHDAKELRKSNVLMKLKRPYSLDYEHVCDRRWREAILLGGETVQDMIETSPSKPARSMTCDEYVDLILPGNPLVCVGESCRRFRTCEREELRGSWTNEEVIVPNPMTSLKGRKRGGGGMSARTLDNTGLRRYLIVEFSFPESLGYRRIWEDLGLTRRDACASLLLHLAQFGPLVMAVETVENGIQGWFNAHKVPDMDLIHFMNYAEALGASTESFRKTHMACLPMALCGKYRTRQEVLFFDLDLLPEGAA